MAAGATARADAASRMSGAGRVAAARTRRSPGPGGGLVRGAAQPRSVATGLLYASAVSTGRRAEPAPFGQDSRTVRDSPGSSHR